MMLKFLKDAFTSHPASVGESYTEHMRVASSFGIPMILAGFACMLHGVFPFLFATTGSRTVARLYDRMITNRNAAAAQSKIGRRLSGAREKEA